MKLNLLYLFQNYNYILYYIDILIITIADSSCYKGNQQWKIIQFLQLIYNIIIMKLMTMVLHYQVKHNQTEVLLLHLTRTKNIHQIIK